MDASDRVTPLSPPAPSLPAVGELRLVLLPLRTLQTDHTAYYRQAVECWERVWLELFDKHRVEQPLFLDHLLRQDEAACIFTPTACVGMILFRSIDFSILNYCRDSYFKEWGSEDLSALLKHGKRVFVTSFLTVHPQFRAFSSEFSFKDVFMDIMVKRFLASNGDVISGVTRRDRGIHDDCYDMGAELVKENVNYMGGRFHVDLVAFYRHKAKFNSNPRVREITEALWASRIEAGAPSSPSVKAA